MKTANRYLNIFMLDGVAAATAFYHKAVRQMDKEVLADLERQYRPCSDLKILFYYCEDYLNKYEHEFWVED